MKTHSELNMEIGFAFAWEIKNLICCNGALFSYGKPVWAEFSIRQQSYVVFAFGSWPGNQFYYRRGSWDYCLEYVSAFYAETSGDGERPTAPA